MSSHTLLVDETGLDGGSSKVIYVGCLVETMSLEAISDAVVAFNGTMLAHPRTSGTPSWVNEVDEARHFAEDHPTLREYFMGSVVEKVPCRVYVVMADFIASDQRETKKRAMDELIRLARATRRVGKLDVIAEQSTKEFQSDFPGVAFRGKEYLPLSIVDYYAGAIKDAHDLLIRHGEGVPMRFDSASSKVQFYRNLSNKIAFEIDLSSGDKSSRRDRTFLKKLELIYNS